jgi:hypothetical protein
LNGPHKLFNDFIPLLNDLNAENVQGALGIIHQLIAFGPPNVKIIDPLI